MGALLGIPVGVIAVAVTVALAWAIFAALGAGVAQAGKEVARKAAPGIVPDDPPSAEELEEKRKKAALEEKLRKAEEEARLAAEAREARRPRTLEQAHSFVASTKKGVDEAAAAVEAAKTAAKARGGGWGAVSDARDALQAAEDLAREAEEALETFQKGGQLEGGAQAAAASAVPPAAEGTGTQEGAATKVSGWHGAVDAVRPACLAARPAARLRGPTEFSTCWPLSSSRQGFPKAPAAYMQRGSASAGQLAARTLCKMMRRV